MVSLDPRFQMGFMIFDRASKHSFMCVCAYVCVVFFQIHQDQQFGSTSRFDEIQYISIYFNISYLWRYLHVGCCRHQSHVCGHGHTSISYHLQVQGLRKSLEEHWRLSNSAIRNVDDIPMIPWWLFFLKPYGNIHGNMWKHVYGKIWKHIWQREPPCLGYIWQKELCGFFEAAMQAAAMLGAVWRPKKLHNFPSKARDIRGKQIWSKCS